MEPERAKRGPGCPRVNEVGGVASGGFHNPGGWGREAQSGVGEAGGANCGSMKAVLRFAKVGKVHGLSSIFLSPSRRPLVRMIIPKHKKAKAILRAIFTNWSQSFPSTCETRT